MDARVNLLRFIDRNAPARILMVSGSDWSDAHNAAILLALGQGYLTLTPDGLVVSDAGLQEIESWEDFHYGKQSAEGF